MIGKMTTTMVAAALIAQTGALAATQSKAPAPRKMCLEASGGKFSGGALRRVADQIQQCDHDGRWVASDTNGVPAPVPQVAGKPANDCVMGGTGVDKQQLYRSTALRSDGRVVEQCVNGKWVRR